MTVESNYLNQFNSDLSYSINEEILECVDEDATPAADDVCEDISADEGFAPADTYVSANNSDSYSDSVLHYGIQALQWIFSPVLPRVAYAGGSPSGSIEIKYQEYKDALRKLEETIYQCNPNRNLSPSESKKIQTAIQAVNQKIRELNDEVIKKSARAPKQVSEELQRIGGDFVSQNSKIKDITYNLLPKQQGIQPDMYNSMEGAMENLSVTAGALQEQLNNTVYLESLVVSDEQKTSAYRDIIAKSVVAEPGGLLVVPDLGPSIRQSTGESQPILNQSQQNDLEYLRQRQIDNHISDEVVRSILGFVPVAGNLTKILDMVDIAEKIQDKKKRESAIAEIGKFIAGLPEKTGNATIVFDAVHIYEDLRNFDKVKTEVNENIDNMTRQMEIAQANVDNDPTAVNIARLGGPNAQFCPNTGGCYYIQYDEKSRKFNLRLTLPQNQEKTSSGGSNQPPQDQAPTTTNSETNTQRPSNQTEPVKTPSNEEQANINEVNRMGDEAQDRKTEEGDNKEDDFDLPDENNATPNDGYGDDLERGINKSLDEDAKKKKEEQQPVEQPTDVKQEKKESTKKNTSEVTEAEPTKEEQANINEVNRMGDEAQGNETEGGGEKEDEFDLSDEKNATPNDGYDDDVERKINNELDRDAKKKEEGQPPVVKAKDEKPKDVKPEKRDSTKKNTSEVTEAEPTKEEQAIINEVNRMGDEAQGNETEGGGEKEDEFDLPDEKNATPNDGYGDDLERDINRDPDDYKEKRKKEIGPADKSGENQSNQKGDHVQTGSSTADGAGTLVEAEIVLQTDADGKQKIKDCKAPGYIGRALSEELIEKYVFIPEADKKEGVQKMKITFDINQLESVSPKDIAEQTDNVPGSTHEVPGTNLGDKIKKNADEMKKEDERIAKEKADREAAEAKEKAKGGGGYHGDACHNPDLTDEQKPERCRNGGGNGSPGHTLTPEENQEAEELENKLNETINENTGGSPTPTPGNEDEPNSESTEE